MFNRAAAVAWVATVGGLAIALAIFLLTLEPSSVWLLLLVGFTIGVTLALIGAVLVIPKLVKHEPVRAPVFEKETKEQRVVRLSDELNQLEVEILHADGQAKVSRSQAAEAYGYGWTDMAQGSLSESDQWLAVARQKRYRQEAARKELRAVVDEQNADVAAQGKTRRRGRKP